MFEVGFSEILVIMAIALVVLGPEKLPRLASQVGRWVGRAKAMARQFREQLEEEANKLDVAKDLKKNFDFSQDLNPASHEPVRPPPSHEADAAAPDGSTTSTPPPPTSAAPGPTLEPASNFMADSHTEASVDSAHERRH